MQRVSESGLISEGGQLLMPMDRLKEIFRRHPGKRVVARFDIVECGSTAAQQAYYFNYILPTIQAALRKQGEWQTEEAVDRWLRGSCPACYDGLELKGARQLSKDAFSDFIDWLKWFAADNLSVYIEDSRVL